MYTPLSSGSSRTSSGPSLVQMTKRDRVTGSTLGPSPGSAAGSALSSCPSPASAPATGVAGRDAGSDAAPSAPCWGTSVAPTLSLSFQRDLPGACPCPSGAPSLPPCDPSDTSGSEFCRCTAPPRGLSVRFRKLASMLKLPHFAPMVLEMSWCGRLDGTGRAFSTVCHLGVASRSRPCVDTQVFRRAFCFSRQCSSSFATKVLAMDIVAKEPRTRKNGGTKSSSSSSLASTDDDGESECCCASRSRIEAADLNDRRDGPSSRWSSSPPPAAPGRSRSRICKTVKGFCAAYSGSACACAGAVIGRRAPGNSPPRPGPPLENINMRWYVWELLRWMRTCVR
mmetsp:Transcript_28669/g.91856  ORF Transcript_28669/g.91856 Transcript_28669/m.91856 type:complete len:339 (+) Transcript_28669:1463-2479(+)